MHTLNSGSREDGWKITHEKTLFRGPFLEVTTIDTTSPTRKDSSPWTLIRRKKAASIAPITPEGQMLLLRQERIPVLETLWEFPAGQVDESRTPNMELLRETALRELLEETGYAPRDPDEDLRYLGFFYTSQGFTNEEIHQFVALNVERIREEKDLDAGEVITETTAFSPKQLRDMVGRNEIRDGNSMALFARLIAAGYLQMEAMEEPMPEPEVQQRHEQAQAGGGSAPAKDD
jgi:ADP-ribose pyrophosphatase